MGLIKVNWKNINFYGIFYVFPMFTPHPQFLDVFSRAFRRVKHEITDLKFGPGVTCAFKSPQDTQKAFP